MATVSIQQAQASLPDLIRGLVAGDEVVITDDNEPMARLIPPSLRAPRKLGTLKGTVLAIAPDFDAPLDDFKDYIKG